MNQSKKKLFTAILAAAVIGVLFVPMLYSSIYLGAFWNPYGKLDKVPVAFVNLDQKVNKAGKEYAIGSELEDYLKKDHTVAWKFVSYQDAKNGVTGTSYYAMVVIPQEFSKKVSEAQDGNFNKPEIIYEANKGKNLIISQISERVAEGLKAQISASIDQNITKSLASSLYDVKISLQDAQNGTDKLLSGTKKLAKGSNTLASGISTAAQGSQKLESGLATAAKGAAALKKGSQKLLAGTTSLSNGLAYAANGSQQLETGLQTLTKGENQITAGSSSLVNGLNEFKTSLVKPNDSLPKLVKGASDVRDSASSISKGVLQLDSSLSTGLNALADGVKQVSDGIDQAGTVLSSEITTIDNSNLSPMDKAKLKAAISGIDKIKGSELGSSIEAPLRMAASAAHPLVGYMNQLQSGTKQVSGGVTQLVNSISQSQTQAASGLNQIISGAKSIQTGSSSISEGLNTASQKTNILSSGLTQLSEGSLSLGNGLLEVNNGTLALKNGLNTAVQKNGELSKGLAKLGSGAATLSTGLKTANDGISTLNNGLSTGYTKMNSQLKFSPYDLSNYVTKPVEIKDNSINDVKYYGEGLAPYFISLSLWLGAMFINLILTIGKKMKLTNNKFANSFVGGFLSGTVLVAIQSVILGAVMINALHIHTTSTISFFLTNLLISIVFFSIMFGLSQAIGTVATPILFIAFILQLSSAGGTFPIETAPAFYKAVSQAFPMTYAIGTLRMIISGINHSVLQKDLTILVLFMAGFLMLGQAVGIAKEYFNRKKLPKHKDLTAA